MESILLIILYAVITIAAAGALLFCAFELQKRKRKDATCCYKLDTEYLRERIVSVARYKYIMEYDFLSKPDKIEDYVNDIIDELSASNENGDPIDESILRFINKLSEDDLKEFVATTIDENYDEIVDTEKEEYNIEEDIKEESKPSNSNNVNMLDAIDDFYADDK